MCALWRIWAQPLENHHPDVIMFHHYTCRPVLAIRRRNVRTRHFIDNILPCNSCGNWKASRVEQQTYCLKQTLGIDYLFPKNCQMDWSSVISTLFPHVLISFVWSKHVQILAKLERVGTTAKFRITTAKNRMTTPKFRMTTPGPHWNHGSPWPNLIKFKARSFPLVVYQIGISQASIPVPWKDFQVKLSITQAPGTDAVLLRSNTCREQV